MLRTSKLLAGVLLAVSAIALYPVIVWADSAAQFEHSAGCHHEFPKHSAPTHDNHQCCVSGHQWAMPASTLTPHYVVAQRIVHAESRHLQALLFRDGPPAFLSHSPPVNTSLRI